jgi:glycerol-3-phosphate dehydrogenase (NAD(P)+)
MSNLIESKPRVGVLGGGSWATALVKLLCNNSDHVNWWMRDKNAIEHITTFGHNPH